MCNVVSHKTLIFLQECLDRCTKPNSYEASQNFSGLSEVDALVTEVKLILESAQGLPHSFLKKMDDDEAFKKNSRRLRIEALGNYISIALKFLRNHSSDNEREKTEDRSARGLVDSTNIVENLVKKATIAVVTALPKEFVAVKVMLSSSIEWSAPGRGAGRRYVIGKILTSEGYEKHIVALVMLPDMGNNTASAIGTLLIQNFPNLRHIIMCGIAGGMPDFTNSQNHVRLGDIVVSDKGGVIQYDNVKDSPSGVTEHRHPPRPPSAELIEAVRYLEARRLEGERPWEEFLTFSKKIENALRPKESLDAKEEKISHPRDSLRRPGFPRVFHSAIASANHLLKDEDLRNEIAKQFNVKAFEMEGSGIADAGWIGNTGYLIVRGICDYCNPSKGDLWQGYAAVSAAAFTRALIESIPEDPILPPH